MSRGSLATRHLPHTTPRYHLFQAWVSLGPPSWSVLESLGFWTFCLAGKKSSSLCVCVWMCECGARVVGLMLMLMLTGLIDPDYFRASYLGQVVTRCHHERRCDGTTATNND